MNGKEPDIAFGLPLEEKPIWAGLYESLHDLIRPPKLPPLELTSKPVPVPDRMAVKSNPWAIGIAAAVNLAILAALLFFGVKKIASTVKNNQLAVTSINDIKDFKDARLQHYQAPKAKVSAGGGGGGGTHSAIDPIKGRLPPFEKNPIAPPQTQQVMDHPKLALSGAINVQKNIVLPDNPSMLNFGVKNSPNVRFASGGQGSGGGFGTGRGGGIGSGSGNGYGPGRGGNTGGGLYRVGGSISAPVPLNQVEAEFSDEARRNKYQGVVLVSVIVDAQGHPQNPRVVRALGMGLDEKALEAVRKYRFRPAMKDGRTPVPVSINVEINFRLY